MKLSIEKIHEEEFIDCIAFIEPHEYRCIGLMALLLAPGKPVLPNPYTNELVRLSGEDGCTEGVMLLTAGGILYHCLTITKNRKLWINPIKHWIHRQQVNSIIGCDPDTAWLTCLISHKPTRTIEYRLMIIEGNAPRTAFSKEALPGFLIRKATVEDAEALFPLQKGYEEEEVLSPGDKVHDLACLANLRRALDVQIILTAEVQGRPVAKAGTNARGLAWDQLGGVYTAHAWRGNGIARQLVGQLSRVLINDGRKVALFVKNSNEPARRAYLRAGFVPSVPFRITYF